MVDERHRNLSADIELVKFEFVSHLLYLGTVIPTPSKRIQFSFAGFILVV